MPPRVAVLQKLWVANGARRYGGGVDSFWNHTMSYDADEVALFLANLRRIPKRPEQTQLAVAGWPRLFMRQLPAQLPQAIPSPRSVWFEWLSERCSLFIDSYRYDAKIAHVDFQNSQPHFTALISYRATPGTGSWTHELIRFRVRMATFEVRNVFEETTDLYGAPPPRPGDEWTTLQRMLTHEAVAAQRDAGQPRYRATGTAAPHASSPLQRRITGWAASAMSTAVSLALPHSGAHT